MGAIALGARVIEKHFTDDDGREGPDHAFPVTPETWREMVDRATELYNALGDSEKRIEENELESAVIQRDMQRGEVIAESDMFLLRPIPNDGIPPYKAETVIGKRLKCPVRADQHLRTKDLE